jgi:CheY-like chemotaxis protein
MGLKDKNYRRNRFILIAEDDEDDRMFYEDALQDFAEIIELDFVENGKELIDHLKAHGSLPDLIFLDLNMPLMDGREALRLIRKEPRFRDIPVVCFATYCSPEDRSFCLDHGAPLHEKPNTIAEFSALIQSHIGEAYTAQDETVPLCEHCTA